MKRTRLLSIAVFVGCSVSFKSFESVNIETYVASTPADMPIKEILNISGDNVDFIRWELIVAKGEPSSFSMKLHYGTSQPNTLGFVSNGTVKSTIGLVEVSRTKEGRVLYLLISDDFKSSLSLIKLSTNVLHILDKNEKLMVGNGGWSYALNKKNSAGESGAIEASTLTSLDLSQAATLTFVGRTPCEPVNTEYKLELSESCLKVKWLLKLYLDPTTHRPTSFYWNRTGHRSSRIDGTWSIETTKRNNQNLSVCRLMPVQPFESIDMLIVDQNVMYFLDKKQHIMTGDENFSFALNRIEND